MKPRRSKHRNQALTLLEVVVVIVILLFLFLVFDFGGAPAHAGRKALQISCVNNLKQIGLVYRVWGNDHGNKYPMQTSITNGGLREAITSNISVSRLVLLNFMVMSNQLSTPRVLHCPADARTVRAEYFTTLNNSNISYFANLDANETFPQMILSGDDNLTINGAPVNPGLLNLPTNTPIAWTNERHHQAGNIGLADGSVRQLTTAGLPQAFLQTGAAHTRFAIP